MKTSSRSPFPTSGTIQLMWVPPSPSSVLILQSVRLSPPAPRMCQSVISKFAGMTSLMYTSWRAVSPLFSNRMRTSYRPFPPTGRVCFPAEKSRRLWTTLIVGASRASRPQRGPAFSALNSQCAGARTALFSGVGSGAERSYSMVNDFPGLRPIGATIPTIVVMV